MERTINRMVRSACALTVVLGACWLVGCQTLMPDEEERNTILRTQRQFNDRKAYEGGYDYLTNLSVMLRNREFLERQRLAQCAMWAEARIRELMTKTRAFLLKKEVAKARAYVYGFGIVGIPEVDRAVAKVKVQILNSWINPRECAEILERNSSTFNALVEKGDLDGAEAFLRQEKTPVVVAYVATIDQSLEDISKETQRLDVPKACGETLAADRRKAYQCYFGGRTSDYLPFEPEAVDGKKAEDYSRLQALLSVLGERLKSQDMSPEEAEKECAALGAEIKALADYVYAKRISRLMMTTQELNARVHEWYDMARNLLCELRRLNLAEAEQLRRLNLAEAERQKHFQRMLAQQQKHFQRMLAQQAALAALGPFDPEAAIHAFEEAIETASPALARIYGDAARVLRLMKRDVSLGDNEKAALLVGAACLDRDEIVRRMLALDTSPDAVARLDDDKSPALLWAVRMGSAAAFGELLAGKADPGLANAKGRTALMEAVRAGRGQMVRVLLDRRVRVDVRDAQGCTALHFAAGRGDTGMLRTLLEVGAPIDALNGEKESPCVVALKANRLNAVRLLVTAGCDLSTVPNALDLAVRTKNVETVKYVVATWTIAGGDVLTRGVARAALEGTCACVRYLVEAGGAIEDVHLDLAVRSGNLETVKYFVEKGCDVQKVRATATPEVAAYLKSQGRP